MPEPYMPPSPKANDPKRLPPLLRRAWYGLNQAFRQRVAHLGITPDQFSILRWLLEGESAGLTQRQISDLMASDPNTITSILQRMEKAGLIARREHEADKRARRVCLQPAGRQAFAAA
ncbi:MAG TPA: MarR family transcriptional regulator, partial [Chthoniobacteraceae bacterium]